MDDNRKAIFAAALDAYSDSHVGVTVTKVMAQLKRRGILLGRSGILSHLRALEEGGHLVRVPWKRREHAWRPYEIPIELVDRVREAVGRADPTVLSVIQVARDALVSRAVAEAVLARLAVEPKPDTFQPAAFDEPDVELSATAQAVLDDYRPKRIILDRQAMPGNRRGGHRYIWSSTGQPVGRSAIVDELLAAGVIERDEDSPWRLVPSAP